MNPNGKLDQETSRRLLDEYCWFWSVTMRATNESVGSLNLDSGLKMEMSTHQKLQQSTICDMNESLLGV